MDGDQVALGPSEFPLRAIVCGPGVRLLQHRRQDDGHQRLRLAGATTEESRTGQGRKDMFCRFAFHCRNVLRVIF